MDNTIELENYFKKYEGILANEPTKEDLKDTSKVAEQNHRLIANLHNLKKKVLNKSLNLTEMELKDVQDFCKGLLTSFVDINYSESPIQEKLLKNSLS
ncbi:hypothetical protein [Psychroserpens mesophilus]|uniref:hypothetical protein n=1 Tax=Psychroserpens mesophilus TaxID=325473 RepID=UPI003D655698